MDWKCKGKRVVSEFLELVSIDSVTFAERSMADRLTEKLRALGFTVTEDEAGKYYNGNAGNLYGFLKGSLPGLPLLFSAHMDTVTPGIGKKPLLQKDGRITSSGDTVLGADDVAGLVEILEGVRLVQESGLPHRDIEVVFPIAEEAYIKGTNVFDFSVLGAKEAYVLDMSGKIGSAALQAPSIISFEAEIIGKAAHAGFEPERGIHTIAIASEAIVQLKQGHWDDTTTLNIGTISGGEATNIVPEKCICRGEVRSFDHTKALACVEQTERIFAETAVKWGASVDFRSNVNAMAYKTEENAPVVQRFIRACERLHLSPTLRKTFGGSDNNNFAKHGICGIVLSCGMNQVHSTAEFACVEELEKGAQLVAELIVSRE